MSMTFEFQISDVSRALTPAYCLPVEIIALGIRLVCDTIMQSLQTGIENSYSDSNLKIPNIY